MPDVVRLRNEYGTRLSGGPADIVAYPGDVVEVPADDADYYVDNYDFARVGDETDDEADGDDTLAVTIEGEVRDFESLEYRDLQTLAGEFDDVAGNQSSEELRAALREKVA